MTGNGTRAAHEVRQLVVERFGVAPGEVRLVIAPYRVCPLGAHVDHQLGQVTAMALDRGVTLAYAPAANGRVRLCSLDFAGEVEFALDAVPDPMPGDWGNYPRGAVRALTARYPLRTGIVGATSGKLAEGGLSSSAAVGVAYLLALEEANGLQVSAEENITLDQAIENGYLGLRNGILDQAAILLSRRGELTHLDCATRVSQRIASASGMPGFSLLIAFSGLRQALVSTDYNRRVEECREAARLLLAAAGRTVPEPVLGRITAAEYQGHRTCLDGPLARRATHFFSEVERVEQGIAAWKTGDLIRFGELVTASGESSIANYECGCEPLIALHRLLVAAPGVHGARFSGAGFRGCCVALVDPRAADEVSERVRSAYGRRYPELAARVPVLICDSDDGARVVRD